MLEATRAFRAAVNAELAEALGAERAQAAAETLRAALEARGAMGLVQARRLPPSSMG
jgi:hypothetical protein